MICHLDHFNNTSHLGISLECLKHFFPVQLWLVLFSSIETHTDAAIKIMANWQIGDSEMEWKRNTLWALVLTLLQDLGVTVQKLPRYNSQYAGYVFTSHIGSGWDWIHWWSHTHGCSIDDQNLKSLMSWFETLHVKVALVCCSPNEEFLNRCAPNQEFLNWCVPRI